MGSPEPAAAPGPGGEPGAGGAGGAPVAADREALIRARAHAMADEFGMFSPGWSQRALAAAANGGQKTINEGPYTTPGSNDLAYAAELRGRKWAEVGGVGVNWDSEPELSDDDLEPLPSTWEPENLGAYLDGTYEPQEPTLMPRTDGQCLLYAGRVHSFHGESESGKSMIAQAEVARVLCGGGRAAYLDFESDASVVVGRLLMMGAPAQAIRERLHYLRPDCDPRSGELDRMAYARLFTCEYTIAVVDGVTEAAAVFGVASKDNDEITKWVRGFTRRLAQRTGAAVVQVDHVTKDPDTRGRFAIGGGAKMNSLDGSAFVVEVKEPLGVGMRGVVVMRVAKDRPGRVRPGCGPYRASDRTQEAARVVVDSTAPGRIAVTVTPYVAAGAGGLAPGGAYEALVGGGAPFRPTALMERVSRFLEGRRGAQSENQIVEGVAGKERSIRAAVAALVEEDYLHQYAGPRKSKLHQVVQIYRQIEDPLSDVYQSRLPPPAGGGQL